MTNLASIDIEAEKFLECLQGTLHNAYGQCYYRELPLSGSIYHDLGNLVISDIATLEKIAESRGGAAALSRIANSKTKQYVKDLRSSKGQFVLDAFLDVARYLKYQLSPRSSRTSDYCFFITNKKFLRYTKAIKDHLEQQGFHVQYLFWNPRDGRQAKLPPESLIFYKLPFPRIWTRAYREFRTLSLMEDRALGCCDAISSQKILIVEGCLLEHHMLGHLLQSRHKPSFCLQWGYFGKTVTKMGWRNMPFDKFLVWGDFFRREFARYNPSIEIAVVGHPTLKNREVQQHGKVILFAVQRPMGQHITQEDLIDFVKMATQFAIYRSDFEVRVRNHPDFVIPPAWQKSMPNLRWHDYNNYTLDDSLLGVRYCVSISSTLCMEAVSYGAFPIYVKMNDVPLQVHLTMNQLSDRKHVYPKSQLLKGIRNLEEQEQSQALDVIRQRLFSDFGVDAVCNVAKEIT